MTAEDSDCPDSDSDASVPAGTPDENRFLALHEDIRLPISDDAPAGDPVLYDEDFRTLKRHVDAIGAATGTADYEEMVALARSILQSKSKDLRVAGYLVLGEARRRGAEGMAEALRAVQGLLDEYWDDLYPEADRMRARGNALQFVADRLPDWLTSVSFEADDRSALEATQDALAVLQTVCLDRMGEHAPALSGLQSDLEEALDDLPARSESTEKSAFNPPTEKEDSTPDDNEDSSEGAHSEQPSPSIASTTEAAQTVQTAARHYRKEDLADPLSYRLLRALRWSGLHSTPPNEQGTTRFAAPRSQRREYLHTLLEEGRYETLVREAESTFQAGDAHVWLDLQRLCVEALKGLGEDFGAAHRAVRTELTGLLRRVPGLPTLTFRDGTPLARPQTRSWIESEGKGTDPPDDQSESRAAAVEDRRPAEPKYEEARAQLRDGTLRDALSVMNEAIADERTEKQTFCRRFFVAKLCVDGGRAKIARALLDRLSATVEERGLDTWNPSLAVEVWRTRRSCYQHLAQEAPSEEATTYRQKAKAAFQAICRVDPSAALRVRSS